MDKRLLEAKPAAGIAERIPALDGLRGIAALIVVASHLSSATGVGQSFFRVEGGQIGVMIFFALSGFLMAHLYLRSFPSPADLFNYALFRFARVIPLFALIVVVSFFLSSTGVNAFIAAYPVDGSNIWSHLLLQDGVSVLWTIPIEIRFYAVFIVVWLIFGISPIAAGCALVAVLVAYFSIPPGQMPIMRLGHYFVLGASTALLVRILPRISARVSDGAFLIALLLVALSFPQPFTAIFGYVPQKIWWEPKIALVIFVLLLAVVRSGLAQKLFSTPPLRFLGQVSYSLYLTHMLVILNLRSILDPLAAPVLFYALALVLALGLSALLFHGFEMPVQRRLRRFAIRRSGQH